jgi:hypothetical protein
VIIYDDLIPGIVFIAIALMMIVQRSLTKRAKEAREYATWRRERKSR